MVSGMNEVGILIKLTLDKIGLIRDHGKRAINILQAVLRGFQQRLAILITAQLAGRGENPGIDQISEDCI